MNKGITTYGMKDGNLIKNTNMNDGKFGLYILRAFIIRFLTQLIQEKGLAKLEP